MLDHSCYSLFSTIGACIDLTAMKRTSNSRDNFTELRVDVIGAFVQRHTYIHIRIFACFLEAGYGL